MPDGAAAGGGGGLRAKFVCQMGDSKKEVILTYMLAVSQCSISAQSSALSADPELPFCSCQSLEINS